MKKIFPVVLILTIIGFAYLYKDKFFPKRVKSEIHLAINVPVKTFDPVHVFDEDSLSVIGQSLDTLYQYHYLKRPYEVIPSLADGMPEIKNNGKQYIIKIKKGIHYHGSAEVKASGRTVKASDFEMQIKRLAFKPLKSVGTWLFSGKIKGFNIFSEEVGSNFDDLISKKMEGVTVIDDYTLKIDLINPEPNLLYFLSMTFVTPVPKEIVMQYHNDLSKVIIGTGAYELVNFDENKYFFTKNLNYREELYPSSGDRYANTENLLKSSTEKLPFIEKVYFHVIKEEKERWDRFMNGEIDILNVPKKFLAEVSNQAADFEKLKQEKQFQLKYATTISSRWLGFNMNDPVLGKNRKLRKAISFGINFDKYIEALTNNTNLKANSIYNPSIPGYNPSHNKPYSYDLKKAKKLLKESGVNTNKLEITYSTRGNQQIHFNEAEFIKNELNLLGLKVNIEVLSFSEFIQKGRAGKIQFFTDQWIYDYPDAENILQLLISKNIPGINKSGYINPKIDELYSKLVETLDKEKRFELMSKIEEIIEADLPWIMLMYESSYILHSKNIKNFRKSFFIRNYLKYLKVM